MIIKIEDHIFAIRSIPQAALRDVIGNNEMDLVLTEPRINSQQYQRYRRFGNQHLGCGCGIDQIQEIELPAEMKRPWQTG